MTDDSLVSVLQAYLEKEDLAISRRSNREFDLSDDPSTLKDITGLIIDASSLELDFDDEEITREIPREDLQGLQESCK